MATPLGSRAPRLAAVRALRTVKGRREQQRYAFEGATLLGEACASGIAIEELYATEAAYEASPLVRRLEQDGIPAFIVEAKQCQGHLRSDHAQRPRGGRTDTQNCPR